MRKHFVFIGAFTLIDGDGLIAVGGEGVEEWVIQGCVSDEKGYQ